MTFDSADPLSLVTAAFFGCGLGVVSGLFGIGGGFLIVPVLSAIYGFRIALIGTASCQALGQATTGLLTRRVDWHHLQLPLTISGGLMMGVWCGAAFLPKSVSGSELAGRELVLGTYAVLLTVVGVFALWDVYRTRQGRPLPRGWLAVWSLPPYAVFPQLRPSRMSIIVLAWFGLVVGFLAGMLGLSAGMIMLPGLIYCIGLRTHQAVAVTLVVVWIVAAQATCIHALNDPPRVDLHLAIALLTGGTIGARIGSRLSERLGGQSLRNGFGWLLLGTAALTLAQLFGILPSARAG